MTSAKDLQLRPISSRDANECIKRLHYSGKVTSNSSLHIGAFLNGRLEGAMSFGQGIDRRKTIGLVEGTPWNGFLELNRLAFSERLPKNSESRALSIAAKLIRQHAPHVKWILSYADGTQCGDGTIYRAAGFLLTAVNPNTTLYKMPNGEVCAALIFHSSFGSNGPNTAKRRHGIRNGESVSAFMTRVGAERLSGYQLRYIKFLDPTWTDRLTVPILPYTAIDEANAGMYRGQRVDRASEA